MWSRIEHSGICLVLVVLAGCNQILGLEYAEYRPSVVANTGSAGLPVAGGSASWTAAGMVHWAASGGVQAGSAGLVWDPKSGGASGAASRSSSPASTTVAAGAPSVHAGDKALSAGTGMTNPGVCSRDAYRCDGPRLTWNSPQGLQSRHCASELLCDAQHCECDLCLADAKDCLDRSTTDTCDSLGHTHTYVPCQDPTPYCSNGNCVACLTDDDCRPPMDTSDCTVAVCTAEQSCSQQMAMAGTACMQGADAGSCDGLGHCGACTPGNQRCSPSGMPERCLVNSTNGGQWVVTSPCVSPTPFCVEGVCEPPPSCRGMLESCGPNAEPCCLSPAVYGATYTMGTDDVDWSAPPERPAHLATVGPFRLDAFEVTVGRFRRFVSTFNGPPAEGSGANPHRVESTGWQSQWAAQLPKSGSDLVKWLDALPPTATWTHDPSSREGHPINHVSWYLAFAFCAYDNGWLPSEAEWELAASGSDPQHKCFYPWGGSPGVSFDTSYATFQLNCMPNCGTVKAFRPVGSAPNGRGAYGQYDLAGNVAEWTFDFFDVNYYSQFAGLGGCQNCVRTTAPADTPEQRTTRGSHAAAYATDLRVTAREPAPPTSNPATVGIRCARSE